MHAGFQVAAIGCPPGAAVCSISACRLLSRIARQDEQSARDPCDNMGRSV
jgi:hypothetical protein